MQGKKLFRLYDRRDKIWVYEDKDLFEADFPEYLKMIQIQGPEFFAMNQWIGESDKNANNIYEEDILEFEGDTYRVLSDCYEVLFERLTGTGQDIDVDQSVIVGNSLENPEMLT